MNNSTTIHYYGWCPYCNQGWYVFKVFQNEVFVECEECTDQPRGDLYLSNYPNYGVILSRYATEEEIRSANLQVFIKGKYVEAEERINMKYSYEILSCLADPLKPKEQTQLFLDLKRKIIKNDKFTLNFSYLGKSYIVRLNPTFNSMVAVGENNVVQLELSNIEHFHLAINNCLLWNKSRSL